MPIALARGCGIATIVATLLVVIVAVSTDLRGLEQEVYLGGWRLEALG